MSEYEKLKVLIHQDGMGPSYRILNTERPVGLEVFIHDPNLIQDRVTFLARPDGLLDVIDTTYGQIGQKVTAPEALEIFMERGNGMVRWGWLK